MFDTSQRSPASHQGFGYQGFGYQGFGYQGFGYQGFGYQGFGYQGFGYQGFGYQGFGYQGFGYQGFGLPTAGFFEEPPDDFDDGPLGKDQPNQLRQAELIDTMRELSAQIHTLQARLCEVIRDVETEGWVGQWGAKSTPHFVSYATGCSMSTAYRQWRVAMALEDMPTVRDCMHKGELSVDQAHTVASVAASVAPEAATKWQETEVLLARFAHECTPAQFQRICTAYDRALTPAEDLETSWRRHLTCYFDDNSSFVIRGRLSNEEGSLFQAALEAARANVDRDAEHRDVEALALMADSYLAGAQDARPGGDRYNINLHIDTDANGILVSEDGARFSEATLARFLCDCSTVTLLERDGETIDVGRKTRVVSNSLRRAMNNRDKGCRFPGCNSTSGIDAHHIEMWTEDGHTKLLNLLSLCRFHHHLVHEGGYRVMIDADKAISFRDTFGRSIPAVLAIERAEPPDLEVNAGTCESRWDGERVDLCMAVGALLDTS